MKTASPICHTYKSMLHLGAFYPSVGLLGWMYVYERRTYVFGAYF